MEKVWKAVAQLLLKKITVTLPVLLQSFATEETSAFTNLSHEMRGEI